MKKLFAYGGYPDQANLTRAVNDLISFGVPEEDIYEISNEDEFILAIDEKHQDLETANIANRANIAHQIVEDDDQDQANEADDDSITIIPAEGNEYDQGEFVDEDAFIDEDNFDYNQTDFPGEDR